MDVDGDSGKFAVRSVGTAAYYAGRVDNRVGAILAASPPKSDVVRALLDLVAYRLMAAALRTLCVAEVQ